MKISNKQRYHFALSSFVRMYGNTASYNNEIKEFCIHWSNSEEIAPLSGLDEVDRYMYYEYKNWRSGNDLPPS